MSITVREIAEQTGHGASNNRFIERLHYWTRERLLLPIGKRNPGAGRRRVYADTAGQDALILNMMMEASVLVVEQHHVMRVVQEERQKKKRDLGRWAKEAEPDLLLVIETYLGRSKPYFHEGPYTTHNLIERVIVFNITRLFAVLPNKTGEANG
jgi:hypothetical protein